MTAPKNEGPKPKMSTTTRKKRVGPSQLIDLFLHVADQLGCESDRDVAELAGVSPENVSNWRSGAVQEFKPQKLKAIKENIAAHISTLKTASGAARQAAGLSGMEIEFGASPSNVQRDFRDRVAYDYLGHRFLYYEPMGALAWENLIRRGYEQDCWLRGVESCAEAWTDPKRDSSGHCRGPIADAVGWGRRGDRKGLDVISLGPGEGGKEVLLLERLMASARTPEQKLRWLAYAPVDVSIPLLLTAARTAKKLFVEAEGGRSIYNLLPFGADFEEGELAFADRLPTAVHSEQPGVRLVMMLGNVLGNLRDEDDFVRKKLWKIARPGDLVWLEVGLRLQPLSDDPLFRLTQPDHEETAAGTNRRLLLEGPYRRYQAATGRPPSQIDMRVWVREDDESCRVPGSVNFCHDLIIKEERRACTMLYSRRYDLEALTAWFEKRELDVLRIQRVEDSKRTARVAHILLSRRG